MDWGRDGPGLYRRDLQLVYKFEPKPSTVLRIIENNFARRSGEPTRSEAARADMADWPTGIEVKLPCKEYATQSPEWLGSEIGDQADDMSPNPSLSGRRGLRTVPFSRSTFESITKAFHMHSSISRAISRADIPVFSHMGAVMEDEHGSKYEASVFNCRTSNSWPMDLAVTVTYFPHCNLKFAVIFGCNLTVEEDILQRLSLGPYDISHPLLLPGIVAETERRRHVHIVDGIVDEIEARISQLEIRPDAEYGLATLQIEKLHKEKRSAWLNIAYIRNCLVSWRKQLENIRFQVEEVDRLLLTGCRGSSTASTLHTPKSPQSCAPMGEDTKPTCLEKPDPPYLDLSHGRFGHGYLATGYKIKSRIQAIIDEYDEMIRDCSMRIDGMAMATQWAQGETNLEIARATSRDSKHMRSIALVTMIFLPGTFFAGVFSMTFFDWSDHGQPVVSKYVWIYIVITVTFTMSIVLLWYYFNIYQRTKPERMLNI
ncbi:hypothetical protein SAMD00023353_2700490 [Rosellinia necatrix]|uniref:Uncharacterized protein n=1 Tax=Rosellinia necatrix TaxID=77044 RepID=A0A1W2TGX1_ROSNE|nr:hypothetical protein SAMD00023353_2700490 [Rosellinia necatrix]